MFVSYVADFLFVGKIKPAFFIAKEEVIFIEKSFVLIFLLEENYLPILSTYVVYTWYTRYNAGQLQACVLSGFLQLMAITIITIELHTHGLIHTWFIDVYYIVFFNTKERGG